ncbi:MAG: hypothetical protein B6244_02545 [Candidatus Cloacimonetes bacterium 4572_55]|nr:MAG: hypothetical protein B6244_02545 [Candidatus Cloacimonetes bacterium 4572_55]
MGEAQKKWIMVGVACLMIAGAYYWFIYQHKLVDIEKLEKENEALRDQIATAKGIVAILDDLKQEMKELEKQWEAALKFLPTHDEIEVVLKKIDNAVSSFNLKSNSFSPGSPQKEEFYYVQTIGLSFKGAFPDFLNFLNRLEKFDRILHPTGISLKLIQNKDGSGKNEFHLNISMKILAYIQEEEGKPK